MGIIMYDFELREREIFEALKNLKNIKCVIIGGYAVNVYTLPRFSVDCDIVVKDMVEAKKLERIFEKLGYLKEEQNKVITPYHGEFIRYEKKLQKGFKVSMDILIGKVIDRKTGAILSADWIFENSLNQILKGKTIVEKIKVRVPKVEALIVMKLLSCRNTDIRDIFMMIANVVDFEFIKKEVSKRVDFNKQFEKLKEKIISKDFKDNLQGVFGFIQQKIFEKHKEFIEKLRSV